MLWGSRDLAVMALLTVTIFGAMQLPLFAHEVWQQTVYRLVMLAALLAMPVWLAAIRAWSRNERRAELRESASELGVHLDDLQLEATQRHLRAIFPRAKTLTVESVGWIDQDTRVFDCSMALPGMLRWLGVRTELTGALATVAAGPRLTLIRRPDHKMSLSMDDVQELPSPEAAITGSIDRESRGQSIRVGTADPDAGLERHLREWLAREVTDGEWRFDAANGRAVCLTWQRPPSEITQVIDKLDSFVDQLQGGVTERVAADRRDPEPATAFATPQASDAPAGWRAPAAAIARDLGLWDASAYALLLWPVAIYALGMAAYLAIAQPAFLQPRALWPVVAFGTGLAIAAASLSSVGHRLVGVAAGFALAAMGLVLDSDSVAYHLLWPIFVAACMAGEGCI